MPPTKQPVAGRQIGPSVWQIVALIAAAVFLSFAITHYFDQRTTGPNAVDIGFLDDMTKHHQQAVSMAFSYFHNGAAPQLPSTASEIIQGQSGDLRVMKVLRARWINQDGETDGNVMAWMGHAMPIERMPGFASNADAAKLDTLSGRDLDDLFTKLMIRHHLGGIIMAKYATTHADTAEVRDLAAGIVALQTREIDEINQWRASAKLPVITQL